MVTDVVMCDMWLHGFHCCGLHELNLYPEIPE